MRRSLRVVSALAAICALSLVATAPATATVIGWRFEGVVTTVLDDYGNFGDTFQVGDTFSGHLGYDTATTAEIVNPGFYRYNDPADPILSVSINGLTYETNSGWVSMVGDTILTAQSDDVWSDGPQPWAIELYLRDLDGGMGTELPTTLDLAQLEVANMYWGFFNTGPGFIEGQVTSMVANPEPGSGLLLAAGLLAVAHARRRRRR